jgi:D-3-phosphoglycerate dehydrogenase
MNLDATVVSTDPIHAAGQALLASAGCRLVVPQSKSCDELASLVKAADILIVRSKLADNILDGAHRLRGVVRHGSGLDFIPMSSANELGIPVASVPGANSSSVAEYVFAAIFELTRHLRHADIALRNEPWWDARKWSDRATEIGARTLGIVGVGSIGTRVAHIGHFGFSMNAIGHQRRLDALPAFVRGVSLRELFSSSDFVVLSCPLTQETQNLVDTAMLSHMKPSACLINVSRGQLIDEAALVAALQARAIAGAALDVFSVQPLPDDHPFRTLSNVLLTPHIAGLTADSMERLSVGSCEEALRLLNGERPRNLANPEVWDAARKRFSAR